MAESIRVFENSLRDYLINVQSDSYNTKGKVEHKYNNLKVYMEPKKRSVPHFSVSVNISQITIQLEPLEVLDGSMGVEEKFIIMWASRPNINGELRKHWAYLTKSAQLMSKQVRNEKQTQAQLELSNEELRNNAEIITGFGVRYKFKAFERKLRKLKYGKIIERISC